MPSKSCTGVDDDATGLNLLYTLGYAFYLLFYKLFIANYSGMNTAHCSRRPVRPEHRFENPVLSQRDNLQDDDRMSMQSPQNLALLTVAAFALGWLVAFLTGRYLAQRRVQERDPRDITIRSMIAELRVANNEIERLKSEAANAQQSLEDTTLNLKAQNSVISDQQAEIDRLSHDLKGSVRKTRELRAELADRATETVHAEAKIREVETELSIAQASAEMLATGVFGDNFLAEADAEADEDNRSISEAAV